MTVPIPSGQVEAKTWSSPEDVTIEELENLRKRMDTRTQEKPVLFKVFSDSHTYTIYMDGTFDGFPEGSGFVNHYLGLMQTERAIHRLAVKSLKENMGRAIQSLQAAFGQSEPSE